MLAGSRRTSANRDSAKAAFNTKYASQTHHQRHGCHQGGRLHRMTILVGQQPRFGYERVSQRRRLSHYRPKFDSVTLR